MKRNFFSEKVSLYSFVSSTNIVLKILYTISSIIEELVLQFGKSDRIGLPLIRTNNNNNNSKI